MKKAFFPQLTDGDSRSKPKRVGGETLRQNRKTKSSTTFPIPESTHRERLKLPVSICDNRSHGRNNKTLEASESKPE